MIAIRLSRYGRKKAPFYRIVAVDSKKKATGAVLEFIGTWNPAKKELKVKDSQFKAWVEKGAQVSATVQKLVKTK